MYSTYFLLVFFSIARQLYVRGYLPLEVFSGKEINSRNGDAGLDIYALVKKYGYPIETHEVITEDGYILTMHRIPHGKGETNVANTKKPPVLLMHGLLCSSVDWINIGNSSLAYNLANAGYDVWLGNNRGNTWSRKHVFLNPNTDKKFWDYSFDHCGHYDIPAKIDYILNVTGYDKVNYVGHSQGTSQFFAFASLRPEYNEKITLAVNLAPVAYMKDMTMPLMVIASRYTRLIQSFLDMLGIHELLRSTPILHKMTKTVCGDGSVLQEICADLIFMVAGNDSDQLDRSFLDVMTTNTPAGCSVNMIVHYLQERTSGRFRRFDYGLKNLLVYKRFSPPDYNVKLITAPVAIYYAPNDPWAAVVNVKQLTDQLPNLVKNHLMEYEKFSHLDFLWAKDVKTMLYDDVIVLLNKYNSVF